MISQILQNEIDTLRCNSGLSYDQATIADRLATVDRNVARLATDEARAQMLRALSELWCPPARSTHLVGFPEYDSPKYNAIEIVVLSIRRLLNDW